MARFIEGNELNSELEKIIERAEKELIIISPFIKLHERIKDKLRLKIDNESIEIIVVFGKNHDDKNKSFSLEDINFLKTFPNIEIRYEKRLHAKYYANENSAILTSMNLYDFSMNNNIEFGILTKKDSLIENFVGKVAGDSLDESAFNHFIGVIDNSELYFKREPKYKSGWLGLRSDYTGSETITNKFDSSFKQNGDFVDLRKSTIPGYCIRSGQKIKFNPKRPFTSESFAEWVKLKKQDHPETYCHFSGEPSNGETNYLRPVLKKNWIKAKEQHKF